jgi:tetratricopeptide (TPR) repeat protein
MEPEKPARIRLLATFLIEKDRNIDEGLELIEKYLKLRSDNYLISETKGWGYYKKGRYKEALEILQKSWDQRMDVALYDHNAFLHLEAAKKAVAEQKK